MRELFDGFSVNIFEDDAGDWIAHFVERPEISAFASTPEDALRELTMAWDGVKQTYIEDGDPVPLALTRKEYSGQFSVHIDRRLHRNLAIEAARAGMSLNTFVVQKLEDQVNGGGPR